MSYVHCMMMSSKCVVIPQNCHFFIRFPHHPPLICEQILLLFVFSRQRVLGCNMISSIWLPADPAYHLQLPETCSKTIAPLIKLCYLFLFYVLVQSLRCYQRKTKYSQHSNRSQLVSRNLKCANSLVNGK